MDSPDSSPSSKLSSTRHAILQRLAVLGVPPDYLHELQPGIVAFVRENRSLLSEIVAAVLPTDAQVSSLGKQSRKDDDPTQQINKFKTLLSESLLWLRWLMFQGNPEESLKILSEKATGKRAVCGAVWGQNDLAYRCRTCEHDPTCAICVPCFLDGDHKGHDYSIIYTGGGCCDCGDATAWKREGFCSRHKGVEQIEALPAELACSMGPVLDALFIFWRQKILSVQLGTHSRQADNSDANRGWFANEFSSSVADMLLEFSVCSESLLSFISKRMCACDGLLEIIVRAERFMLDVVVKKLLEMLLKFLGEPLFKYNFAKVFIGYYPLAVSEAIKETSPNYLKTHPLVPTFSVQIFTVPSLTPRLVQEANLFDVLFGCLRDLFNSCLDEVGHLQANKLATLCEPTCRLIEDIRYIMSHQEVPKYIICEQPDILRTWMRLLTVVQGMDPQKRATTVHTEDDNYDLYVRFVICYYLGNVNAQLTEGAFSVEPSIVDSVVTEAKDAFGLSLKSGEVDSNGGNSRFLWLIFECLMAIDNWLAPQFVSRGKSVLSTEAYIASLNMRSSRKKLCLTKSSGTGNMLHRTPVFREADNDEDDDSATSGRHKSPMSSFTHCSYMPNDGGGDGDEDIGASDMRDERASTSGAIEETSADMECDTEEAAFSLLSLAEWQEIVYDVSSQEISFHIPLHRFLSLLLRKTMKSFYGGNNLVELENIRARGLHQQQFFAHILMGCHPYGFASSVMEHPLRLRVFCAQVRSGMWRKNGDASILSYEWYRSVRWFEQGMESDLFLLQCCAGLAPPERFVHRIQERFGLSSYTALDLGEYNEYEAVLVQDMLSLLIQIVKERRFCGSSVIDNLKRELVHKLAIGDATHSQLVKVLPRDLSKGDQLQSVLDMLAVYSNPSGMRQGKYSLRKEFWSELDLYHPRWTPTDLQVAEERYLHFCKVSALNAQIPQWTNIFDPLAGISRIATSKAAFLIVRSVLFYALYTDKPTRSRAPDGLLITALHLLYLALDICEKHHSLINGGGRLSDPSHSLVELTPNCSLRSAQDFYPVLTSACEKFDVDCADSSWTHESMISLLVALMKKFKEESRNNDAETRQTNISSLIKSLLKKFAKLSSDCMSELKLVAPEVLGGVSQHSSSNTGKDLASTADCEERKAKARERQAAILAQMKAEQSKFMASLEASNDEEDKSEGKKAVHASKQDLPEDSKPLCSLCRDTESTSPLCYLVLVQKSRLLSLVEKCPPSWEDIGRTEKKIQRSGSEGQLRSSGFAKSVPLNQVQPHIGHDPSFADVAALWDFFKGRLSDSRSTQESDLSFDDSSSSSSFEMVENDIYHSILQDIHSIEAADAQTQSTIADPVCSNMKNKESSTFEEGKSSKLYQSSMSSFQHNANSSSRSLVYSAKCRGFGPKDCDGIHISSCGHAVHQDCHDRYLLSLKQRYSRRLVFEGGHIVEPDKGEFLCPLCRRFTNSILPVAAGIGNAFGENMTSCSSSLSSLDSFGASNRHLPYALSLIKSTAKFVGEDRYLSILSGKLNDNFEPALEPILRKLCILYYSQLDDSLPASNRQSSSLLIWDTLKYALLSAEVAARGRWITYPSGSGPQTSLSRDIQSNWFVLLLLLHVAQSTRSRNSQEVLLRFKGIQLMARSICNGVSEDGLCLKADDKRGIFLQGASCKEDNFPDIQFWRQAADPILAHDPFSSLVWALFCLPLPFLSSGETFISLVHLFYIVCVVQGLVTCYSKQTFDRSYFSNYILHDICNMMAASEVVNQFFVSNFNDCSWHPKDRIRRLTFPYLRRCLLLWKLLKSSKASFHDCFEKWDGLGSSISDGTDCNTIELNGIKEIEDLFQIQPLQVVLNDGLVCSLASKWCEHFLQEFTERKCGDVLHSTPAVPFRLMQLPKLYQDLLQRCIKLQCSECKSVPDEPALCLLCGKLCSPNWKSCCSASRCLNHAMVCGAGVGIFLLVRKTTIILQRSTRQALWPSPYLDAFGEEDHDMLRGRPLYLSEERYATLTNLVASHGMDQSSEVLRSTSINLFGAD